MVSGATRQDPVGFRRYLGGACAVYQHDDRLDGTGGPAVLRVGALASGAAAAVVSAAASICCVGPLALTVLGVNGMIMAAAVKPYRGYLLAGSLVLLSIGFWSVYRRRTRGSVAACPTRSRRLAIIVLWASAVIWVGALIIQFLADRYWL